MPESQPQGEGAPRWVSLDLSLLDAAGRWSGSQWEATKVKTSYTLKDSGECPALDKTTGLGPGRGKSGAWGAEFLEAPLSGFASARVELRVVTP